MIVKAYTDIEQSRKLAEILPLESADMCYDWFVIGKEYSSIPQCRKFIDDELPCWSLAALLKILKDYQLFSNGLIVYIDNDSYRIDSDNPIDACYEMIIKLYEPKML